jgi:hypothetical protein
MEPGIKAAGCSTEDLFSDSVMSEMARLLALTPSRLIA